MGIYDRDYYRGERSGLLGAFQGRAQVCKWLIVLNVAVFVLQLATQEQNAIGLREHDSGSITESLLLNPTAVLDGEVWRLISYAFLHSTETPWHILFNMLFLWWMGNELEDLYGSREFLCLYLVSAMFAGICFGAHSLTLPDPPHALGASGAVLALTVLFACHYPNRTVLLFFVIPMPIWLLVVIYVGFDFLAFLSKQQPKTAVAAHLGGAMFGFLYYRFNWKITGFWSGLGNWRKKQARPNLRIYRDEEPAPARVAARVPAEHEIDEHLEAKLDAVLEKVSLVGKDNLTEGEKEILLRASEIYRKRRN